jgi:hypothetical protein
MKEIISKWVDKLKFMIDIPIILISIEVSKSLLPV